MEAQGFYGKRQTYPAQTGYWKKTGSGIREQLKDGWIEYYNGPLTVERMKTYLLDIFLSRVDEQDRKVVAVTGTLGSMAFHDMLASEAGGLFTLDTHFINKYENTPGHLSYGAQFSHYRGPEGIEVTLIKNPMYDSRKYCKRMHPDYPEFPVDSMRFTFLDFGSAGKDNNIMQLKVKDTYRWGYLAGTHTPTGPNMGGPVSVLKAGYDMFTEGTCGYFMVDPSRGGELIYDFEA